ncbi:NADPH:quinone oxidoreductase family protein [Ramlibacter sp.]|uniref:NADPH:quinone oxidoreductase family protein n=1 Tax=Ramlibacter sp. TaxID=1917967 RepID=UPI003D0DCDA7
MKAVLCKAFGSPDTLAVEDVASPVPGDSDVVVAVHACGVNLPDALVIAGKYQLKPPLPFSPGGEVAGVVTAAGPRVDRFRVGERVIALPLYGGYAEELLVPQDRLLKLPDGIDFAQGAAFAISFGTAHYALRERARLAEAETLLVLGAAGGSGLAAIALGKLMGARVIAAASTREKLDLCIAHGADAVINYVDDDLRARMSDLTDGRGVDVIFDPVGGELAERAMRGMAWNGRFLVIGFASGDITKAALNLPLLKGFSIIGVSWGAFLQKEPARGAALVEELMTWFRERKLTPHIEARLPLEQAGRALAHLVARQGKGKTVLIPAGRSST